MHLENNQAILGTHHSNFKFFRLVILTTILTFLYAFPLYLWNKNYGIAAGMIALLQPHFIIAYFFAAGVYQNWFVKKIFWRNFSIWAAILVAFYLFVYRYLGNGLAPAQQIDIVAFFGILLFNFHNAIDMVKFQKAYHVKFDTKKWIDKEIIFILAIYAFLVVISLRAFTTAAALFGATSSVSIWSKGISFGVWISGLIGIALFLYLVLQFFLEKRYKAMIETVIVALTFVLAVIFFTNLDYIDVIATLILWHGLAWFLFSVEKIHFFQKKLTGQSDLARKPKQGLDAFLFWPKAKVSNFLIFFFIVNLIFIIPIFFIVKQIGVRETFSWHPFYGLYWFVLYAGGHIVASLIRDVGLLSLPRRR